jgi:AcrR family transcriptional regulator
MSETPVAQAPRRVVLKPLYPQLQPRWCGLDCDGVARNQQSRLLGAMLEVVGERGYERASVKRVSALAGVSRQTFYEQFGAWSGRSPKEECFLAAYDHFVDRAVGRISAAYLSERDPRQRLCRAFQAFLGEIVEQPNAARVALVEAFGAGPAALARMERARTSFEPMIAGSIPDGATLHPMIVKGIVGGVERVTRMYLLDGRIAELPSRAEELSTWVSAHQAKPAMGLAKGPPRKVPARKGLSRAWVQTSDRRTRILRAAAAIAGTRGYSQLSVGRIIDLADVSHDAFSEFYSDTEECFLGALELLGLEALACLQRASLSGEDWATGVHRGVAALMDHLAGNPLLGRLACVEVFAVGPSAIQRRTQLLGRFTDLLRSRMPQTRRPSELSADATVGAIWAIVHHHVTHGATRLLPGLADHATYMVLAPVIGAEEAVQSILSDSTRIVAVTQNSLGA